jgi:hypothetical protein
MIDPNKEEEDLKRLKDWILGFVRVRGSANADEIYKLSECTDMMMYTALHELIDSCLISGADPKDNNCPWSHAEMIYTAERPNCPHCNVRLISFGPDYSYLHCGICSSSFFQDSEQ